MIKFTKMEGLGNDYVYIDAISQHIDNRSNLAIAMSNRHFGIGSDGIILICKSSIADFKMQMFNQDGSEAQMCGNGIRCVGKYVYDKGLTQKTELDIETLAGIKKLYLNVFGGEVQSVKVDMGEPILDFAKIPLAHMTNEEGKINVTEHGRDFSLKCVSMGNPHAVTIVDNVDAFEVKKYGSALEINKVFPEKANIEFVQIINENTIKMRVWERGAGETLACGTGACASVVACNLLGKSQKNVEVQLLGGNLKIEWDKENNHVFMTGPARTVFEGTWNKD